MQQDERPGSTEGAEPCYALGPWGRSRCSSSTDNGTTRTEAGIAARTRTATRATRRGCGVPKAPSPGCPDRCGPRPLRVQSVMLRRRDLEVDRERHVGVQLGGDGVLADRLDRVDVEVAAIELDAGLRGDRLDDVGRRDRTEQAAFLAGLRRDLDHLGHQRAGDRLATPRGRWRHAGRGPGASWRPGRRRRRWPSWPAHGAAGSCGRSRRTPR